jgi:hypothetical protein
MILFTKVFQKETIENDLNRRIIFFCTSDSFSFWNNTSFHFNRHYERHCL